MANELRPPTGHVFRVARARGPVWFAKYRLPDGRQVQKKIGAAWAERGRPPARYVTKRTAEDWLRRVLDEARSGTLLAPRSYYSPDGDLVVGEVASVELWNVSKILPPDLLEVLPQLGRGDVTVTREVLSKRQPA